MKIVVTHASPDLDAITSVWLIKRFLPGWNEAQVEFVPAGERSPRSKSKNEVVEVLDDHTEMIHVDTGLGPLDHHETDDKTVCGASRTWDYIKIQNSEFKIQNPSDRILTKIEAIERMVKVVIDIDHFQEVFWVDPIADYHEFSLLAILEGLKLEKPDDDLAVLEFGMECLDAILHNFENRIWAEKEIEQNAIPFQTKWGKGLGFETINDSVLKLAQKMGHVLVIRKDPRKGYVRIKARPEKSGKSGVDLTPVYDKLKVLDPQASWYLHVSRKMLLNGSTKNPDMKPSKLSLNELIKVVESV